MKVSFLLFLICCSSEVLALKSEPVRIIVSKPGAAPVGPVGIPETKTGNLNLGALVHDGPTTPEQISLLLPLTGSVDLTAKTSVIYRPTGSSSWTQAHPLHRMRPEFAESSEFLKQGFAGVITGLLPGQTYDVQVAIKVGATTDVKTLSVTTRALPGSFATASKTIAAGSSMAQIAAVFAAANPGDVIQFADGTYNLENLTLDRSGTLAQPIVIRGSSRNRVILKDLSGPVLHLVKASHVVVENLTLVGSGVDSGVAASSNGIAFWSGFNQEDVVLRNLLIKGVDQGIIGSHAMKNIIIYDCTLQGNNSWDQDLFPYNGQGTPGTGDGTRDGEQNVFWNDDGIRIPGLGNVAFHNTLTGFGDALAVSSGVQNAGVHFYRNEITMTGDDFFEGDYGVRNMTFYDNRAHNTMTFVSFDPMYGGPVYVFRNIAINVRRGPLKLNSTNTGLLIYNNTVVTTDGANDVNFAWVQYNNGDIDAWSFRNNLILRYNVTNALALESGGQKQLDFSNNGWFPAGGFWWTNSGGSFSSLEATKAGLPATVPLYGASTKRHDGDLISEMNPFETNITLGSNYRTLVSTRYYPLLKSTSVLKNKGAPIAGITDGFSGSTPDIGGVIPGRPPVVYGDHN